MQVLLNTFALANLKTSTNRQQTKEPPKKPFMFFKFCYLQEKGKYPSHRTVEI